MWLNLPFKSLCYLVGGTRHPHLQVILLWCPIKTTFGSFIHSIFSKFVKIFFIRLRTNLASFQLITFIAFISTALYLSFSAFIISLQLGLRFILIQDGSGSIMDLTSIQIIIPRYVRRSKIISARFYLCKLLENPYFFVWLSISDFCIFIWTFFQGWFLIQDDLFSWINSNSPCWNSSIGRDHKNQKTYLFIFISSFDMGDLKLNLNGLID